MQMFLKCLPALLCHKITRIWLLANKQLFNAYKPFSFESFNVSCKVTIGNIKILFKRVEIKLVIDCQNRHDSKPHPTLKSLMKTCIRNHFSYFK